jgi:hypothetical protein
VGNPFLGGAKPRDLDLIALSDDDQWHTAEVDARLIRKAFPEVTHLKSFHFCTSFNGRKDQEYWLDDFVVAPR